MQTKVLVSQLDKGRMYRLLTDVREHSSGGKYDMVARLYKRSVVITGYNSCQRFRGAETLSAEYPCHCGVHAELDLSRKAGHRSPGLRRSTVYIAGRKAKNGKEMSTTKPCEYCDELLWQAGVKAVVYMQDGLIERVNF